MNRLQGMSAAAVCAGLALAGAGCDSPAKPLPSPYPVIHSEKTLIESLAIAYRLRDYPKIATLFADQDSVSYFFILSEPTARGETSWGAAEERRIHRRMFQPESPLPGEVPVPHDFWLVAVDISLTPETDFVALLHPGGLNPARWRVTEATYDANVYFQLAGDTDYLAHCRAHFVVVEDKTKPEVGSPGRWLLYRWGDLPLEFGVASVAGAGTLGVQQSLWGHLKALYR